MKELTRQMSIDELSISDVQLNISGVEWIAEEVGVGVGWGVNV